MDLQAAIRSELTDARRTMEVFRKGVVMAIDTTVTPWLATINGRPMPFIDEQIAVGDVVFYVDQPDPFAWARILPDLPYYSIRQSATYEYKAFFFSYTSRVFNESPTGSADYDSYLLIGFTSLMPGLSPVISPTGPYPDTPTELFDETVGSGQTLGHYEINLDTDGASKWRLTFGATKTFYWDEWRIAGVVGVEDFAVTHGSPASYPKIVSPGQNWLYIYGILHETSEASATNGSFVLAPGTLNAYNDGAAIDQGHPNDGDLWAGGQVVLAYEISTSAGSMPTRTPTVTASPGHSYSLFTLLLERETI